ncbi:MAG: peptidoglycan-binding protein [Nitrosomonas sp.]|nr:peptidoglycan-binding protein [Nitrosomonas sp.]MCW5607073.1 peptidoglycan-binding protein [Nitrosomonas sp.]
MPACYQHHAEKFGPTTHAAVIAFQAENGLVPDGIVGPRTSAALGL